MATIPENYNTSSLHLDPWGIKTAADPVTTAVGEINNDLLAIIGSLNDLKLSWTGTDGSAAQTASDFNDRWAAQSEALYGIPDDPTNKGILNILSGGVQSAAANFSQVESHVNEMFTTFYNNLTASVSSGAVASAVSSIVSAVQKAAADGEDGIGVANAAAEAADAAEVGADAATVGASATVASAAFAVAVDDGGGGGDSNAVVAAVEAAAETASPGYANTGAGSTEDVLDLVTNTYYHTTSINEDFS